MQSSPGPFIMQCLLGCAGVSPRTTQLQPVLVCCARLHCVPTVFCCLLLDFLCSSSLVFPFACFLLRSVLYACVQWQVSLSLFFFFCYIFLNLLLKLSLHDLLQLFEQNISISSAFVVFLFVSLSLKLSTLSFEINCHIFLMQRSCLPSRCAILLRSFLSSTSESQRLA